MHHNANSLIELANKPEQERVVFGEYHALNSANGSFLLRDNRYKLIHHVNQDPQLFDLSKDPDEINDLSQNPEYRSVLDSMIKKLREICDPEEVDRRAKADQKALVEKHGGREAILNRGFFENSPVPGEKPAFRAPS